jgi:hypothetical protein
MKYICPKCERSVSLSGGIVLAGKCGDRKTIFVFDPEPGRYELEVSDGEPVEPGSVWDFSCPLCGKDLTSKSGKRMARLDMIIGDISRRVVFSKVANEHATFVLGGEDIEAHGEDSKEILDR